MTNEPASLATCYSGWGSFQKNLVAMLTSLSPEQLALPAGSHH
ncbi:MAG TPA: hypothetical protein VMU89_21050 [Thermomicrobiaceae bacterium]|nr:hypothetical protein [Thermomicrobiaceae bacterium]